MKIPYSKENEMMVLGCALAKNKWTIQIVEALEVTDFCEEAHAVIFKGIQDLCRKKIPVDIHILTEHLKEKNKLALSGGIKYLVELAQFAGTSAYVEEYISMLQKDSYRKHAIFLNNETSKYLSEDVNDPELIASQQIENLRNLSKRYASKEKTLILDKSQSSEKTILEKIKERKKFFDSSGKPYMTGLSTGFKEIDQTATILQPSNLVIIAGRPAMGKTAFALNIAAHICIDQKKPICFMSLEMARDQIAERIISLKSNVPGIDIERGCITNEQIEKIKFSYEEINEADFFIYDKGISIIFNVLNRTRILKEEENIQILVVDYLQLLSTGKKADSRQYEVAEVSRALKQIAMELAIPVICVAQLSRKTEERGGNRPRLSDLRDSGQIEQDADVVCFLYREKYYEKECTEDSAEVIIAKNRHGPTFTKKLSFNAESGLFMDQKLGYFG